MTVETLAFNLDLEERALLRRALATQFDQLLAVSKVNPYLSPETDAALKNDREAVLALWKRLEENP